MKEARGRFSAILAFTAVVNDSLNGQHNLGHHALADTSRSENRNRFDMSSNSSIIPAPRYAPVFTPSRLRVFSRKVPVATMVGPS
jgi:hypothetical protein